MELAEGSAYYYAQIEKCHAMNSFTKIITFALTNSHYVYTFSLVCRVCDKHECLISVHTVFVSMG